MTGMDIRPVEVSDFKMFGERFGEFDLKKNAGIPDPVKMLKEEFELGSRSQFVAVKAGKIVGFISVSEHKPGRMYVRHLMISDDARGEGVSGRLIDAVLAAGIAELHIWTETTRFPDFSDLLGFRVVESQPCARYVQRIEEMDLAHSKLPRGWEIRKMEERDIDGAARFLVEEGLGDELTDYGGDPSSQDGQRKGQAYLKMVCEEFADYFLVCLREGELIGVAFGGLSLDLARGGKIPGTKAGRRGWVQWLVASRKLGPDQRRECFAALLSALVQRMRRKGALWFEALVDPTDRALSEAMDLTRLEIQDEHRFVHMVRTPKRPGLDV